MEYKSINIFYGEDLFGINQAEKIFIDKVISPEWQEFNLNKFDGKECDYRQVIDAYKSPPFGEGGRLVIVNFLDKKSKGQEETNYTELLKFCAKESENNKDNKNIFNYLLLKTLSIDKRLSNIKTIEKYGLCKEFAPLKTKELIEWVTKEFQSRGQKIEEEAAKKLVEIIASDRYKLIQEINKLSTYALKRDININDVNLLSTDTTADIFSIIDNLALLKKDKALIKLNKLLQNQHYLVILMGLITNFKNIYYIKLFKNQNYSSEDIVKYLKVHPYIIKKVDNWKNFSLDRLKKALEDLIDIDNKLKTSVSNPLSLLEFWILKF